MKFTIILGAFLILLADSEDQVPDPLAAPQIIEYIDAALLKINKKIRDIRQNASLIGKREDSIAVAYADELRNKMTVDIEKIEAEVREIIENESMGGNLNSCLSFLGALNKAAISAGEEIDECTSTAILTAAMELGKSFHAHGNAQKKLEDLKMQAKTCRRYSKRCRRILNRVSSIEARSMSAMDNHFGKYNEFVTNHKANIHDCASSGAANRQYLNDSKTVANRCGANHHNP